MVLNVTGNEDVCFFTFVFKYTQIILYKPNSITKKVNIFNAYYQS